MVKYILHQPPWFTSADSFNIFLNYFLFFVCLFVVNPFWLILAAKT